MYLLVEKIQVYLLQKMKWMIRDYVFIKYIYRYQRDRPLCTSNLQGLRDFYYNIIIFLIEILS